MEQWVDMPTRLGGMMGRCSDQIGRVEGWVDTRTRLGRWVDVWLGNKATGQGQEEDKNQKLKPT